MYNLRGLLPLRWSFVLFPASGGDTPILTAFSLNCLHDLPEGQAIFSFLFLSFPFPPSSSEFAFHEDATGHSYPNQGFSFQINDSSNLAPYPLKWSFLVAIFKPSSKIK